MKELTIQEAIERLDNGESVELETGLLIHKDGDEYLYDDNYAITVWAFSHSKFFEPENKKRLMTKLECFEWAQSEDSLNWAVRRKGDSTWFLPQAFAYDSPEDMERIKFERTGIVMGTLTDFTIEPIPQRRCNERDNT